MWKLRLFLSKQALERRKTCDIYLSTIICTLSVIIFMVYFRERVLYVLFSHAYATFVWFTEFFFSQSFVKLVFHGSNSVWVPKNIVSFKRIKKMNCKTVKCYKKTFGVTDELSMVQIGCKEAKKLWNDAKTVTAAATIV